MLRALVVYPVFVNKIECSFAATRPYKLQDGEAPANGYVKVISYKMAYPIAAPTKKKAPKAKKPKKPRASAKPRTKHAPQLNALPQLNGSLLLPTTLSRRTSELGDIN